jgi:predicted component of type VI protein secretion system
LKNAVHLWITRVELYDDHPSAISNNKVSPICDPTAVVQEDEEKLVSPASSNKVAPIIIRASASPVATLATASIASENEDDLQSTSTTSASFPGKEGGDDEGGRIKRPEPFICVHIHPSAKKKLKVNSMYT